MAYITCAGGWYCPIYGIPNVAAMIHRHVTSRIQPVRTKRNHHSICHSDRNEMEWRNLPKLQVLSCGGSYSNVVDSSTPLRCGRNDNGVTFLRIRPLFLECFTLPRGPHQSGLRPASFPQGKLLYRAFGWYHSTARVIIAAPSERHIGRSLRFRWRGYRSNHTGCIRGVACDESSPLHCVVPFNRTGCIPGGGQKNSRRGFLREFVFICWRCRRQSTCPKAPSGCRRCAGLRWPC